MTYKGGSVLFMNHNVSAQTQILKILQLATQMEIIKEQPLNFSIIYKLTFDKSIGKYLQGLRTNTTQAPAEYVFPTTLIIKYTYDSIQEIEYRTETHVLTSIASSTNSSNIFPICPNHLYSEIIQQLSSGFTKIGDEFTKLITKNNLTTEFNTFLDTYVGPKEQREKMANRQ